jgi:hypothetical protein
MLVGVSSLSNARLVTAIHRNPALKRIINDNKKGNSSKNCLQSYFVPKTGTKPDLQLIDYQFNNLVYRALSNKGVTRIVKKPK